MDLFGTALGLVGGLAGGAGGGGAPAGPVTTGPVDQKKSGSSVFQVGGSGNKATSTATDAPVATGAMATIPTWVWLAATGVVFLIGVLFFLPKRGKR